MKGKIIGVAGHAGAGKNTLMSELNKKYNFVYLPSFTTRKIRTSQGEVNGNPYYFVSKEEFETLIKNNKLIEYEKIHENYYGTSKELYEKELEKGSIMISDMGVEGCMSLKNIFCNNVINIFIKVDNEFLLIERLKGRKETQEEIENRMKRLEYEKGFIDKFDIIINNEGSLEDSLSELESKLKKFIDLK